MLTNLGYLALGAAIGAITGVPIGPVNVAVIDTAYRHTLRRAIAVGLGGAVGDGLYALLGIVGVGPFLERHPEVPPFLYAISGVVLLGYGILTVRSKPIAAVTDVKERAPNPSGEMWSGFILGLALIVLNPATLAAWVLIVGPSMQGLATSSGLSVALGVACGSFLWFVLVAYLSNHGKKVLGDRTLWMITRVVGVLLILYALFSLGRAVYAWFF